MISGGNPVGGGNPAGTGSSLNFIGKHAYGYSGVIDTNSNNETTLLLFSMPSSTYFFGRLIFNATATSGSIITYKVLLDNQIILQYAQANSAASDQGEPDNSIPIILPNESTIKITATNQNAQNEGQCVLLTGEMYA